MTKTYLTDFVYGKWFIHYALYKLSKDKKSYDFVPIFLSFGYGRLTNVTMKGLWFSLCLFNRHIGEGEKLPGLHIIIPIKKALL